MLGDEVLSFHNYTCKKHECNSNRRGSLTVSLLYSVKFNVSAVYCSEHIYSCYTQAKKSGMIE